MRKLLALATIVALALVASADGQSSPGQPVTVNNTNSNPVPVTVTGGTGSTVTANQGTAGSSAWPMKVDQTTPGTTNGVVVNSSALPTGAATSANQTTSNSSLSTIATNTTGLVTTATDTNTAATATSAATIATNTGNTATSVATLAAAVNNPIPAQASPTTDNTHIGVIGSQVWNGSTWTQALGDSTNGLKAQVGGLVATGSAAPANPVYIGCRATTAAVTAQSDGAVTPPMCTSQGKLVQVPYSFEEARLRGSASVTTTGATTLIAAQGANIRIYVTGVQCFRDDTGTSAVHVTLNDGASSILGLMNNGGGGGNNQAYAIPLVVAANTALTFTASSAITTIYCNAQGYFGP